MDWAGLRRHLLSLHSGKPQEMAHLEDALRAAQYGVERLAAMGHRFHLAPGTGQLYDEYPRTVYHVTSAPNGRLVHSEFDLWDLGEGWYDTLEEAQYADGVAGQMRGRGGRARAALPVPLEAYEPVEARLARKAEIWRKEREKRNGSA